MDENEEDQVVGLNDVDSEILGRKGTCSKQKLIIISLLGLSFVIILIIAILIIISARNSEKEGKEGKDKKDEDIPIIDIPKKGTIKCIYNIENISLKTQIIGEQYESVTIMEILIDGNKIKFSKVYQFSSPGNHNIDINIYEDTLSMEKMFQNIKRLVSVQLIKEENAEVKITSMISTFEGCENLVTFTNKGFNTEQVNSLHKLFYDSALSEINFEEFLITKNVVDMSYLFGYTSISELKFENIDTSKTINMSHMFEGCSSLESLDISKIDTSKVKDMSYMFSSCDILR